MALPHPCIPSPINIPLRTVLCRRLERGFTLRFLPEGIKGVRVKWGEVQVISKKQKRTESYYLTLHLLSIKLFL
jgi:hypothetical protein